MGAITGLADLDDKADGSSVANKNYVDDKVQSINGNRPFVYYLDGKKWWKGKTVTSIKRG